MIVQISGQKGVGKSNSLFVLAIKLTAGKSHTVLYFTERSLSTPYSIITKAYLNANKVTCSIDDIAGHLAQSEGRKFVVCADIGKCNDPEGGAVWRMQKSQ